MPNRTLKDTICTSESLATVSAQAERLFYHLLVKCDDYGRFHGNPKVIRAECFPLRIEEFTVADVQSWLNELVSAGMVNLYSTDKRRYIAITSWREHNKPRADKSKYPSPDDCVGMNLQTSANICKQTKTNAVVHDIEHDIEHDNEVCSPIPEESDDKRSEKATIFEHWNQGAGITHRKMTDKIRRSISGALGNYSEAEITTAIDNYSKILRSPAHYFKFKWTLADFLQRGLEKFMAWKVCDANYRKDNGKAALPNRNDYTPTEIVKPVDTTGLTTPQINAVLEDNDNWTVRQAVEYLRSKA